MHGCLGRLPPPRRIVKANQQAGSQQRIEAQSSFKPDRLIKGRIRIAISALFDAACFACLFGALRRQKERSMAFCWGTSKRK